MPIGLKITSAIFFILGTLSLVATSVMFFSFSMLSEGLQRSGILFPVFLFANVVVPAAVMTGSVGLWYRAKWAWWICAAVCGVEITKKCIVAFISPWALLGTYPVQQNMFLIVTIVVLVYLFKEKVFRTFHSESLTRPKALGFLALGCIVVGGLYQWQVTVSAEALRSNIELQPTPKDSAAELSR